jgi:hypothetical protein
VFVTATDDGWRILQRRSHGVQALDGGSHLPLSSIDRPAHVLTTFEVNRPFVVGDSVQFGSQSLRARVHSINGDQVSLVSSDNHVFVATYARGNGLPASSEFSNRTLSWNGSKVTLLTSGEVALPAPSPDTMEIGSYATFDGIGCRILADRRISSTGNVELILRRIDVTESEDRLGSYPYFHGASESLLLVPADGGFYGLPQITNIRKYAYADPLEIGALYRRGDGRVVAVIENFEAEDGEPALAVHQPLTAFECPDVQDLYPASNERLTLVGLLARAGQWSVTTNSDGHPSRIKLQPPAVVVSVAGLNVPLTNASDVSHVLARCPHECPSCSTHVHPDYVVRVVSEVHDEVVDLRVCARCASRHPDCPQCGVSMGTAPSNVFGVCRSCYIRADFNVIMDYSYKPKAKMHGDGPLHFGTEVELVFSSGSSNRKATARDVIELSGGLFYAKRDGSIGDGIEFVSHPFSLPWLQANEEQVRSVFNRLQRNMMDAECCGIHIHTSKIGFEALASSLPNGEKLSKERRIGRGLMRVQRFIYGNPELVVHFAGRRSSFANLDVDGSVSGNSRRRGEGTPVREMKRLAENLNSRKENRYAAVNMTNQTVEFRIFKSTTSYEEYARNILFIDSVIQYCRSHALPKNGTVGVQAYRKFLASDAKYLPVLNHLNNWHVLATAVAAH